MKNIKQMLLTALFALGLVLALPTAASAATQYYVTTGPTNLRVGPGTSYKVNFQLPAENVVKVLSKSNSRYYKVLYQNSNQQKFTGYVVASNLKKATFYKTTGNVNLRKAASENSAIVTVLPKGASVIVVNNKAVKWYKSVYFSYGGKLYRGYVSKYYLTSGTSTGSTYVATGDVNMRASASASSKSLVVVRKGRTVSVKSFSGKWAYCTYKAPSGTTYKGYVSKEYLLKIQK